MADGAGGGGSGCLCPEAAVLPDRAPVCEEEAASAVEAPDGRRVSGGRRGEVTMRGLIENQHVYQ